MHTAWHLLPTTLLHSDSFFPPMQIDFFKPLKKKPCLNRMAMVK